MDNFCTLFNSSYLNRGLALYDSLKTNSKSFHLYIFAFDNLTEKILKKKKLSNVTVINLKKFEDKELIKAKKKRTKTEYFWTCTGSTILFLFKNYKIKSCTYIDSDIFFFEDPKIVLNEINKNSCGITIHNYSKKYDQTKTSGKYCVQFLYFRNDNIGNEILDWWKKKCLEWCFNRFEDNKFGDQKYLDDWLERFKNVHVIKNQGAGVAPWNMQKFFFIQKNNKIQLKINNNRYNLNFFHFHNLRFLKNRKIFLGGYDINRNVLQAIYKPYISLLNKINTDLIMNHRLDKKYLLTDYYNGKVIFFRILKRILLRKNFLKLNFFNDDVCQN
jgi:hypothetical protein